ncbi:MAG: UPF0149 family protein [Cellvibrionaceae bacterium]
MLIFTASLLLVVTPCLYALESEIDIMNSSIPETQNPHALPDFDGVADLFVSLGALNSPAELHGMLCGQLSGGNRFNESQWQQNALDFLDINIREEAELDGSASQFFDELYVNTLEQFKSEQFELDLLLPSDETDLDQRISSLSHWCHGFLSGFGSSGITGDTKLSEEMSGILRDFAAFVQINPDDAEDEESEADYMEIVDYVQVAVKAVFMEIGFAVDSDNNIGESDSPTMH